MTPSRKIAVIHRFGDVVLGGFVDYSRVIDHSRDQVAYFVNARGRKDIAAVEPLAAEVHELAELEAYEPLRAALSDASARLGGFDLLIALSEFDLSHAARLRSELAIPGVGLDRISLYRDKIVMKERLRRDGIRVPRFLDGADEEAALAFARETGYPLIVKPRRGAASQGVRRAEDERQLREALRAVHEAGMAGDCQVEEFVAGPIFHIDGLVKDGELAFYAPSQYVGGCLGFAEGRPNGSFIVTDRQELRDRLQRFTEETLRSLELTDGCFHLEVIDRDGREAVFLEIGARMGGAETPFLTVDLYGVNLCEEWIRIELGTFEPLQAPQEGVHGGLIQFPEPPGTPAEVVSVSSLLGVVPEIYDEWTPQPGEILDGKGSYYHISGRYRLRGESEAAVEKAILRAMGLFRIEARPLAPVEG
ncbi:ATP-grasp domain-containing protein [Paenibacillus sp. FSL W8-1187]|uniref:Putative nikkomycin biosynthesis protein, carboxylase n=1 Tax=Paenibacillus pasadenensis TaxID=217090 RepID=A0A2N5N2Y4_9BACL|nr:ATP-grasp domain-containing protein [Paenibacillus pasadenensis]PLT44695.1 putative nikkomycin biosynthesis protein, carboxylase [Paenibacillus pasadenensis]